MNGCGPRVVWDVWTDVVLDLLGMGGCGYGVVRDGRVLFWS